MFKLSKKIEYAILALQHLSMKQGSLLTAKELSSELDVPFEFLSKSLQKLMKSGIVESVQGTKGGYQLSKPAEDISIEEVFAALDEKQAIVECASHGDEENCHRIASCSLKTPMSLLQSQINQIFKNTTIAQLSINKENS